MDQTDNPNLDQYANDLAALAGVLNEETPGVDDRTGLKSYVNELEAELDEEIVKISAIDSDYNPNTDPETSDIKLDPTFNPIDDAEANAIRADATREQTSADYGINNANDDES